MNIHINDRNLWGTSNSIISKTSLYTQVANFRDKQITLPERHLLGYMHLISCLQKESNQYSDQIKEGVMKVSFIQAYMKQDPISPFMEEEEELSEPIIGGPKTSKLPEYKHIPKD